MTERSELQILIVAKLREQAEFHKRNIATWQLLEKAANEIERLQRLVGAHGESAPPSKEKT